MLTVGSLFAGIGGFDLGLERAGMRVIWQSEIDPYASAVLRKHWPTVPNLGDVRSITATRLAAMADAGCVSEGRAAERSEAEGGRAFSDIARRSAFPDVICGGFPCQDISNAGRRAGIDGERSGLWSEYARIIGELRPRYVIVENVAALLGRGIERVLGDLAALGFDAEWHCIPASAVGAPHRRDRVWIVAYARCERNERRRIAGDVGGQARARESEASQRERVWNAAVDCGAHVADADRERGRLWATGREDAADAWESSRRAVAGTWESEPDVRGMAHGLSARLDGAINGGQGAHWASGEWLGVGRVAHGIPKRVDRLRCLGNAIVPQIAEIIGRAIVSAESRC
jgi:DNA (cytosine-5)-methyltransferase 1